MNAKKTPLDHLSNKEIMTALEDLRRNGMVEMIAGDDFEITYRLTEKGKRRARQKAIISKCK